MKTKILILLTIITLTLTVSCNKDEDNCQEKINEINEFYDRQEGLILSRDPIDYEQLRLVRLEREAKLNNACK